ncbi:SDR family NAD(P)-dependent oxidoreductase [Candidatus Palauibacter sp.]|uniref:SDR family NAD(P)-dependent oxidoreductase n=1 Tax=Candidatus Palauibacter sp. TaxID=3101350 RepID=UPI003B022173
MKLEGTVALVTGGARRLGRALTLGLAEAGCDLFIHYGTSAEAARRTAGEVRALGRRASTAAADLTDPAQIDRLFEAFDASFGRLDILVNSAASFERTPFDETTVAGWDAVQALNLRAPFLMAQRAARRMRAVAGRPGSRGELQAPGVILNMSDMAGVAAWRGFTAHGVSKAGLVHLTATTARELGPDVRVNVIVPGPILPPAGETADDPGWRQKGLRVPLERTGDAAHVAHAAVFLAENDYVTGATIHVDGGEHLLPGGRG